MAQLSEKEFRRVEMGFAFVFYVFLFFYLENNRIQHTSANCIWTNKELQLQLGMAVEAGVDDSCYVEQGADSCRRS